MERLTSPAELQAVGIKAKAGHQVTNCSNLVSRARIGERQVALVEQPQEGQHDLTGDLREEDGQLLGLQIQGGAGEVGTHREEDGFVNLNCQFLTN